MWPFNGRKLSKDKLAGIKTVTVNGFRFKIRRVNPLLDFHSSEIPSFFTDNEWANEPRNVAKSPEMIQRLQKQMYRYIEVGLVEPHLVEIGKDNKRGKEDGITVEDLFRDPMLGAKLFNEIVIHSANECGGLKGLFFSIKKRHELSMAFAKDTAKDLTNSSLEKKN